MWNLDASIMKQFVCWYIFESNNEKRLFQFSHWEMGSVLFIRCTKMGTYLCIYCLSSFIQYSVSFKESFISVEDQGQRDLWKMSTLQFVECLLPNNNCLINYTNLTVPKKIPYLYISLYLPIFIRSYTNQPRTNYYYVV